MYHYRFAILWAIFILFACGANPGTLAQLKLTDLFSYDKPIHALLFGIQSWLLVKAAMHHTKHVVRAIWLWCAASALFGASVELMQKWFFIGRSYDYFDLIANTIGCIIALTIALRKYSHVRNY